MMAYHTKYFGDMPPTDESLAQALYLHTNEQENFVTAVNNGICTALGGE
ncbi:hypothetical protein JJQ94_15125 [Pseudoalteromonas sp. GCY]|nr:hypothetical protein [Pseudoalteromonas sp. GCY]QQQ69064.1 hypothetical protein JJQ94_15125 [Pseudoalteromonas sp. GCY]